MAGGTLQCIQSVPENRKLRRLPQLPTANGSLPHLNFRVLCESAAGCSSAAWWRRRAKLGRMKSPSLSLDCIGSPGSQPTEDPVSVTPASGPFTPTGASGSDSCENSRPRDTNRTRRKKKRKNRRLVINLSNCKYESVRRAARRYGLRESCDTNDWSLFWTDCSVSLDRALDMKGYQKINHFPGMSEICRKDTLARNMSRMQKLFPKEYHLLPRTWCLPADYGDLQAYGRARKHKTYICKPDTGCQGRGIFITRSLKDIGTGEDMICQLYISKPFIVDGFKFDLRVYVLVTSCDPLRIFVYNEGLARFATTCYSDPSQNNLDEVCMHLTNYSINKHSENFIRDDDSGSKRKLSTINKYLQDHGYDTVRIWADIEDVIIKTLISAHPTIKHNYTSCFPSHSAGSACFEILGFDILLDRKLRPWLLEVNHSPSFSTDSRLDREVKDALLYDTLVLINLGACSKKKVLEEERQRVRDRLNPPGTSKESRVEKQKSVPVAWLEQVELHEEKNMGGFRRIYPTKDAEKYEKFFQQSSSIFQETAASKARGQCARQQLQELRLKQELKVIQPKVRKGEQLGESAAEKIPSRRDSRLHRAAMARGTRQLLHNSDSCTGSLPPKSSSSNKSTDSSPLWQPLSEHHHSRAQTSQPPETSAVGHSSSVPNIRSKNFSITERQPGRDNEPQHCGGDAHRSAPDATLGSLLIKRTDLSINHEHLNLFLSPSVPVQLVLKRAMASKDASRGHSSAPQTLPANRWRQDQVSQLCEGGSPGSSLLAQESPPPLGNVPLQVWKSIDPGSRERSLEDCEMLRKQRLGPTEELPIVHEEQSRKPQHGHRARSAVHLRRLGQGDRQKLELAESHLVMPNTSTLLNLLVVSRPAPLFQRPGLGVHTRRAPHTGDIVRGRL
ncbi:hypothetical protein NDU88_002037 [Pleurodeles waltl]|uniref:Tubulin polyglutamylase TTLL6 n=1 Tax=Pleurodeles waltl TaxID=8319 RepID=A0AAV7Q5P4_PLEWA|nr:hypothetical protein NDU88_002037 [Pleurodeles waltl]